jgi:large subunit ribosomal protein L11e
MDFYIVMGRPGNRISRRKHAKARVGSQHRVQKEESIKWFQKKYDGIVLNK